MPRRGRAVAGEGSVGVVAAGKSRSRGTEPFDRSAPPCATPTAEERGGIDLAAVLAAPRSARAGPVERPVEPISAIGLAAGHGLADGDQGALVVAIAGDVAVTVIDLDQRAVARALAGPGDDARGHGDDLGARRAGEVDALVEGLVAGEGVLALAEVGGDEAALGRAGLRGESAG